MLKKQITYENPFTQQQVTETHFFHISKADLVEMEMEEHGVVYTDNEGNELTGMQAKLQKIVDSEDGKAIMAEIKDIIRRSYGVKEGERFIKTEENWKDFSGTEAFSQLLFELCTQADAAAEFMNGVVPHNLDQISAEVQAEAEKATQQAAFVEKAAQKPETAEASSERSLEPAPTPPIPFEDTSDRKQEIENATTENPVTLTEDEVREMDMATFKTGLADGRYKLS